MKLKDELLEVFTDTNFSALARGCNITFLTFLRANYTDECINREFPKLAKKLGLKGRTWRTELCKRVG